MERRVKFFLMALLAVIFLGVSPVFGARAQWTFMVYLDGDNNLEGAGLKDFTEMAEVGSNADINILVQMDRIPGHSAEYEDWTGCKRFKVDKGMTPTAAHQLQDLGEVNMADPKTLKEFINWGVENYPAEKYALILWNHGSGWHKRSRPPQIEFKGICSDDTSGHDILYMHEVKSVLKDQISAKMDMIGFDACLMGMIEVAYQIRDTGASVMVGSEELEPGDGWPYNDVLGELAKNPTWNAAQLGYAIVEYYYDFYENKSPNRTQSVIDLSKMDALSDAVSDFAEDLISIWDSNQEQVKASASQVMNRINQAVIHEKHGNTHRGAKGMAVYFPKTISAFEKYKDYYSSSSIEFSVDNKWDEFLNEYHNSMSGSWIEDARNGAQEFQKEEGGGHIDLHHFCSLLINPVDSSPGYSVKKEDSYSFTDISTTGTEVAIGDESHQYIEPGFTFSYYGTDRTGFSIADNGVIYFEDIDYGNTAYQNGGVPTSSNWGENFIAPLWDDLNPDAGGRVYYEAKGDQLIVQWNDIRHYEGGSSGVTFQAVLYGDGRIFFNYQDMDFGKSEINNANSATVGIQGTYWRGLQYAFNSSDIESKTTLSFTPVGGASSCIYDLSADKKTFSSTGGKGAVTVTAGANCQWGREKDVGWITFDSPIQVAENSIAVNYTVSANESDTQRIGHINIKSGTNTVAVYTITQDSACVFTVDDKSGAVPAEGGTRSISVDASREDCSWKAIDDSSWIAIVSGASGIGNGTVQYKVDANPGTTSRNGAITVAGKVLDISQVGVAVVNPTTLENGKDVRDLVQDKSGSLYYKIQVPSGTSRFQVQTWGGAGNCDLFVRHGEAPYENNFDYSGTTNDNEEAVVVQDPQAGNWFIRLYATQYFSDLTLKASYEMQTCDYALSSQSQSFAAEGGSGSVDISAPNNCSWTVSNPANWIELLSSAGGKGDGKINFKVAPNAQEDGREVTIVIVDQPFTVSQDGVSLDVKDLVDGVAQSFTSSAERAVYYRFNVPEINRIGVQTTFSIRIQGDSGDADLYVRHGEIPTLDNYDYAPLLIGSNEDVQINNPDPGDWFIMAYAYESVENISILADFNEIELMELDSGVPKTRLAGDENSFAYFQINVPANQGRLVVGLTPDNGESGDADLYIKYNDLPTTVNYDSASFLKGNFEKIYIDAPDPGEWIIMVYGYENYMNLSIKAEFSPCGYTVLPLTLTLDKSAGSETISVITDPGCPWNALGVSWLEITSGANGTGAGEVTFSFTENTGLNVRKGLLLIADQWVNISQLSHQASDAVVLQNGDPKTGLAGTQQTPMFFKVNVPADQKQLVINSWGGDGDADIYLRHDSLPTPYEYDYSSNFIGNKESINIPNPSTGTWYVMMVGYQSVFSGTSLMAFYTNCAFEASSKTELVLSDGGDYTATIKPDGSACGWAAFSTVPWISITSPASGTGQGVISYSVESYTGAGPRNGAVKIADQEIVITQLSADFPLNYLENEQEIIIQPATKDGAAYFKITVPPEQRIFRVQIWDEDGQSGDMDLYVRYGSLPTQETYDFRPYMDGSNESAFAEKPAPGNWYIMLHAAKETVANVFLKVRYGVPQIIQLTDGSVKPELTAEKLDRQYFKIEVPEKTVRLTISSSGGTGDCDLYARFAALPNLNDFDARPYMDGNFETVSIETPDAGTWYAMLNAYDSYSDVVLTANLGPGLPDVIAILQALCGVKRPEGVYPDLVADEIIDIKDALRGLQSVANNNSVRRSRPKPIPVFTSKSSKGGEAALRSGKKSINIVEEMKSIVP